MEVAVQREGRQVMAKERPFKHHPTHCKMCGSKCKDLWGSYQSFIKMLWHKCDRCHAEFWFSPNHVPEDQAKVYYQQEMPEGGSHEPRSDNAED